MSDEQMQPLLEAWFRDREATPHDVRHSASRIMARVPQVRQRGRWWPLPSVDHPAATVPSQKPATAPITTTRGRTRPRGFTVFSALKFITASIIVALVGGFLLAGVFTTQQGDDEMAPAAVTESPSPMTAEELLAGMVTEEVEPGIFWVVNDGVRELTLNGNARFVAGLDGSVWLMSEEDGIVRLGSDESYPWPEGLVADHELIVMDDGEIWVSGGLHHEDGNESILVYSLQEGSWIERHRGPGAPGPTDALTLAPDGAIWFGYPAGGDDDGKLVLSRLGPDGWEPLEALAPVRTNVFVTRSSEVWVADQGLGDQRWRDDDGVWQEEAGGSLWRYGEDDDAWQEVAVDALVASRWGASEAFEVEADGTVWFAGIEPLMVDGEPVQDEWGQAAGESFLMRFDGDEWQRWGPADGVPPLDTALGQAADGGLWVSEACPDDGAGGVARFDDPGWQHFLSDLCVQQIDMAPDGSVWLILRNEPVDPDDVEPFRLYVITPGAVAGTES